MNTLPEAVSRGFILLALLSFLLCVLLPFGISTWRFFRRATHQELEEQILTSSLEGMLGALLGLLIVDGFLYILTRSLLPKDFFYITLGSINFLVACFLLYHLFNRSLASFMLRKSERYR